jgi:glycosyltransferase involved in cell wall biosynthesis
VPVDSRRVVLAANSSWNVVNFRGGLIRALKAAGYEPVVVAPLDPPAEQRLEQLGVERIVVRLDRSGLNPVADFRLLGEYRRILKELRPVAFLGFTIKPNIYGCTAARTLGIPVIANISGLGTVFIRRGPLLALVTLLYRFALSRAEVVFFQNPDDLALFIARKMARPDHARLLPGSGIDLDRFAPSPQPAGPTTFLLIARLLGDKGVREFVEAARILRQELPGARFQLLGPRDDGNRTAISREELDRWVAEGVVEYLGETDDVRPFIEQASAVVLPSYREGLPRSLLEAGAMARPLVATDVPGCREVVVEGKTGFLCRPRDSRSLAAAMRKFAQMPPDERQAMAAAARRRVEEKFSENVVIRAYLDALGKIGSPRS